MEHGVYIYTAPLLPTTGFSNCFSNDGKNSYSVYYRYYSDTAFLTHWNNFFLFFDIFLIRLSAHRRHSRCRLTPRACMRVTTKLATLGKNNKFVNCRNGFVKNIIMT